MRIPVERSAVGMIGGEEDAPGIVDQQEQLQADRPLQRVDEALVAILERNDAAAGIALDVHHDPLLGVGRACVDELAHRVAGRRAGLAEHHLTDVDRDILVLAFTSFGDARGTRGELHVAFGIVAVELDVGEMDGQAIDAADRIERRLDAARDAKVAAVNVQGMGDAQLLQAARERDDDVARGNAVVNVFFVEVELALVELEGR